MPVSWRAGNASEVKEGLKGAEGAVVTPASLNPNHMTLNTKP